MNATQTDLSQLAPKPRLASLDPSLYSQLPLHAIKDKAELRRQFMTRRTEPLTQVSPPSAKMDVGSLPLPKYMKYSSKPEYNDLEIIRERIRMQRTFHNKYDPFVDSKLGRMYY